MVMSNSTSTEQATTYIQVCQTICGIVDSHKLTITKGDEIRGQIFTVLQRIADQH